MMERFKLFLQRFFETSDELQGEMSARWRLNANTRTVVILIVLGTLLCLGYLRFIVPPPAFPIDSLVTVPEGQSLAEASETLQAGGVIRSPLAFQLIVRLMGEERSVHAGDYLFKQPRTVFSVAHAVVTGSYGLEPIRIRIPEGMMARSMAEVYASHLERFDKERFLAEALPIEGYLFPDTYFFMPNATEDTVLKAMRQNFDNHIASVQEVIDASGHTLQEIVTMASMLEREARITKDRRMIAGVLWNRLDRDMALQVDAVFLYSLGRTTFDLTIEDLTAKDDPYNTYVHKGLPPTAIGSPSLVSILAAADPEENDFLFYLADNTGVTHYSKTYAEHLRLKRRYLGS
jgi:UPF0755 protein